LQRKIQYEIPKGKEGKKVYFNSLTAQAEIYLMGERQRKEGDKWGIAGGCLRAQRKTGCPEFAWPKRPKKWGVGGVLVFRKYNSYWYKRKGGKGGFVRLRGVREVSLTRHFIGGSKSGGIKMIICGNWVRKNMTSFCLLFSGRGGDDRSSIQKLLIKGGRAGKGARNLCSLTTLNEKQWRPLTAEIRRRSKEDNLE